MFYLQHLKAAGHYLYLYPPGHRFHTLKYSWTLDRGESTKFETVEALRLSAKVNGITEPSVIRSTEDVAFREML